MKKIKLLSFLLLCSILCIGHVKAYDLYLSYYSREFVNSLKAAYPKECEDGILTDLEKTRITTLEIDNPNLNYISYSSWGSDFPYLKKLVIKNSNLESIDIGEFERLEYLDLSSNNDELGIVNIDSNKQLNNILLPKNLKLLTVANNVALTNMNLNNYVSLGSATFNNNERLMSITVQNCNNFSSFESYFNEKLTSVNIKNNPELSSIRVFDNPNLKSLIIENNKKLVSVYLGSASYVNKLDLSSNPSLTDISIYSFDNLSYLNFSTSKKLGKLYLYDIPNINSLDLSTNMELTEITINEMESLKKVILPDSGLTADFDFTISNNGSIYNGSWYVIGDFDDFDTTDVHYVKLTGQILSKRTATETDVIYQTQVQKKGWLNLVSDGMTSGTVGEGLRMESLRIVLSNQGFTGNVEYRTHIQKKGWESTWKKNGEISGTVGQGLRLEALQLRLTGEMAKNYDIYYRVQAQRFGWLGWSKNGASAGTAGFGFRLEAIQIKLVKKGSPAPGSTTRPYVSVDNTIVAYQTQVQKKGWLSNVKNGVTSGTVGSGLRMEALKIKLANQGFTGNIEYRTHIQKQGWESTWKKNGEMSGTQGKGLRLEALQLRLTGNMAKEYDIYYRVHAQRFGWLGWAKNGESAGTAGYGYRLEAIQIVLVRKGMTPPGSTANHYYSK